MKIVLCAINSKFIHSSLSVRCLYSYAKGMEENIEICEFTINNSADYILSEIYKTKADCVCFSCYIWNMEFVKQLCADIEKIMPGVKIIIGGPEVSFPPFDLDDYNADIICCGEGEETFKELAEHFIRGNIRLEDIDGIVYKKDKDIIINKPRQLLSMDLLPFPYENIEGLENKIIYYETARGCPYNCAYCLSSTIEGVRFLDMDTVYAQLDFFLENKARQVKFVDRTFNCHKERAVKIWQYIIENDNGYTNFHFEIGADLLEESHIQILAKAREGLIQFEAGVQSTNPGTLEMICRTMDLEELYKNVLSIKALGNIHLHLDLIAGLPLEGYVSFEKSFNDTFKLRPEMLQLGFLKALKGSALRKDADKYGLVYKKNAPYEVLYTNDISYDEILKLKGVENILETYYNSNLFEKSLEYLLADYESAFKFFEEFSFYWSDNGYDKISHTKQKLFEILYQFDRRCEEKAYLKDFIKFDMFMNENVKSLPEWLDKTDYAPIGDKLNEFYSQSDNIERYMPHLKGFSPKQLSRMCHIERFGCKVDKWNESDFAEGGGCYYLFVYGDKTRAYSISFQGGGK